MRTRKLTLSEKIFRITRECKTIKRTGVGYNVDVNMDPHAYVYPKIEDLLEAVGPLLDKYKLILTGQVAKDPMTHISKGFATTELSVDWKLTDIESKEFEVFRIPGSARDDEGKGTYKSLTGSRKYAYVFIFNLKFGDEPEELKQPQQVKDDAERVQA